MHPRVHGENEESLVARGIKVGASPCARGKPGSAFGPWGTARCIPVCTGKTSHRRWASRSPEVHPRVHGENSPKYLNRYQPRVHPRVHGENEYGRLLALTTWGASPCARGKLPSWNPPSWSRRCIPVCTGKTRSRPLKTGVATVHPRVHGENSNATAAKMLGWGASPCARGKPDEPANRLIYARCIPVCTGKTW